jgi:hypothetical protein
VRPQVVKRGVSIGAIIGGVIVFALLGVAGLAGYRYHTQGYILNKPKKKTTSVRIVVVPKDADIVVNDEPLTTRPFTANIEVEYRFVFNAPGRMTAQRIVKAGPEDTPAITLRLPNRIAQLSPAMIHAAGAGGKVKGSTEVTSFEVVDAALGKLRLYGGCLDVISEPLARSQKTYLRTTRKGRIKKSRLPTVEALPARAINQCRIHLANARDRKPSWPALDRRADEFLSQLNQLVPILNRLATYYEQKQYDADGLRLGKRKHRELRRAYRHTLAAHRNLLGEIMEARLHWQMRELATIGAREGLGAHWHLRRVVVASQSWVWALLRGARTDRIGVLAAALATAHEAAAGLSKKNAAALASVGGSAAYLAAAKKVVEMSTDPKAKKQRARALELHNQSVALFNKMIL